MGDDFSGMNVLRDERWRYALLGGLASIPFTVVVYLTSANRVTLVPVFFGGALAGYLVDGDRETLRWVGLRAGAIGALPATVVLVEMTSAATALGGPVWLRTTGLGLVLGTAVTLLALAAGLGALVGFLGARAGAWLTRKTGRRPGRAVGVE